MYSLYTILFGTVGLLVAMDSSIAAMQQLAPGAAAGISIYLSQCRNLKFCTMFVRSFVRYCRSSLVTFNGSNIFLGCTCVAASALKLDGGCTLTKKRKKRTREQ